MWTDWPVFRCQRASPLFSPSAAEALCGSGLPCPPGPASQRACSSRILKCSQWRFSVCHHLGICVASVHQVSRRGSIRPEGRTGLAIEPRDGTHKRTNLASLIGSATMGGLVHAAAQSSVQAGAPPLITGHRRILNRFRFCIAPRTFLVCWQVALLCQLNNIFFGFKKLVFGLFVANSRRLG